MDKPEVTYTAVVEVIEQHSHCERVRMKPHYLKGKGGDTLTLSLGPNNPSHGKFKIGDHCKVTVELMGR